MLAFGWASAQSAAPAGYPTVVRPSDSNAEGVGYDELKQEWVNAHPAEYQALIDGKTTANTNTEVNRQMDEKAKNKWVAEHPQQYQESLKPIEARTTYTRDQLKLLPADKQQSIISDSKFTIIDNK